MDSKRFTPQYATMGPIIRAVTLFLLLAVDGQAADDVPDNGIIIGVTQQLVAQQLDLPADSHFDIAFDLTYVHPQPEPNYWAVVGGFMASLSTDRYEPHSYVAAVRLLCPDYKDLKCWRLDKFALDNRIIYDVDRQTRINPKILLPRMIRLETTSRHDDG